MSSIEDTEAASTSADKPEVVNEAPPPHPIIVEIDKWFVEHFHGSIVSQSTEVYNHVLKAVTELKARLTK